MKLLLDTHVFLWFISGDQRLPDGVRDSIRDLNNEVYIPAMRQQHQITSLSLDEVSVSRLASLPLLHRDPFDRMLICQALAHGLVLVTVDEVIAGYSVPVLSVS